MLLPEGIARTATQRVARVPELLDEAIPCLPGFEAQEFFSLLVADDPGDLLVQPPGVLFS